MNKLKFNFNFVGKFPVAVIASALLVLASIFVFAKNGLNYGVDFRGGAEIQTVIKKNGNLKTLRKRSSRHLKRVGSKSKNNLKCFP